MAHRLPVLPDLVDRVEITTPCEVPWDSMYGDERVRHCGSCRQNVYNVAALTRAQAAQLISSRERLCLRIFRRPDGTVVTADCWSRLRAARRRGVWAFVAMLIVIGWAQLAAMAVGLAGLRRLTATPQLGGATAPSEAGHERLMGFLSKPPEPAEREVRGHMKFVVKPPEQPDGEGIIRLGRMSPSAYKKMVGKMGKVRH